jgi:hypothetical protein
MIGVGNNPPGLIGTCCTHRLFFIFIRLCRESTRGWLITTRFVTHPIEHGMAPMIFWGPRGPGAVF